MRRGTAFLREIARFAVHDTGSFRFFPYRATCQYDAHAVGIGFSGAAVGQGHRDRQEPNSVMSAIDLMIVVALQHGLYACATLVPVRCVVGSGERES